MSLPPMMSDAEQAALRTAVSELSPAARLLEYGAGGSTCLFADCLRPLQHLTTVEHNRAWFDKLWAVLAPHPAASQIMLMYVPPELPLERYQFARPEEEMPAGCTLYLHPERVATVYYEDVELVLVDGIARGAVLATLRTKLKPGTRLFLHDYTGREMWYNWAVELYERVALTEMLLELRVPAK